MDSRLLVRAGSLFTLVIIWWALRQDVKLLPEVAHELAHNLGLFHAPSSDNLLATTSPGTVLTAEQIQIIRDSPISQEI